MELFLFCLSVICLGVIVRLLWPVLLLIWYGILLVLSVIVSSWLTALVLTMGNYIINGNVWEGFDSYWKGSAVFYVVCFIVWISIELDIINMADGWSLNRPNGSLFFRNKKK